MKRARVLVALHDGSFMDEDFGEVNETEEKSGDAKTGTITGVGSE